MRHAGMLRFTWPSLRTVLGLPEDLVLDGMAYDPNAQIIGLIIEGNTDLPQVPDGAVVPWVEYESLRMPVFEPSPLHLDVLEAP